MKYTVVIVAALLMLGCGSDGDLVAAPPDTSNLSPTAAQAALSGATMLPNAACDVSFMVEDCKNHQGPLITLDGSVTFVGGINGRLIFSNNVKGTHTRVEEVAFDVVLIPRDHTIQFEKQPSRGGVGGNPHIWWQLVDADGNPLSDEVYLGRCVQLSK